jgi:hypothetical protein
MTANTSAQASMGSGDEATCAQCGEAFTRPTPKSRSRYCSSNCRQDARDDRALAPLRKYNFEHPEPTDEYDITYRAMTWPPGAMNNPAVRQMETLITVQGWGNVPPHVRAHIIRHEPEVIPADILALCPGNPLKAMRLHLGYDPRTFHGHGVPCSGMYQHSLPSGVPAQQGLPASPDPDHPEPIAKELADA